MRWPRLTVAVIALFVAILSTAVGRAWKGYKKRRSEMWPICYGQIDEVTIFHDKYGIILTLNYSYPVPDEPYPIPAEFQMTFGSADDAEAYADALSKTPIPVRVDPANSWRSQLDSDLDAIVEAAGVDPRASD
jgi:hypothetical protein